MLKKLQKFHISSRTIFFIIFAGIFFWDLLLGPHSYIAFKSHEKELKSLERLHDQHKESIVKNRRRLKELSKSNGDLEKYARERFYMKRPNERVYVIIKE
ncbi:septum formation initiator family protein [Halosquirtibacter laminarini]|uniref:Septum formation initiator family protein n=1 Tax=Halosquirtibacter laminarini TaxID=3374600 RepID=A0AC61NP11_9BACT|nr:septum formation initiator family protein [Prolixibacteraceae bacterium]